MCKREQLVLVHLWQDQNLGIAPFNVKCMISLPSREMAEKNPSAYQNGMVEACQEARAMGVGLGTCESCGQSLMINVVIEDVNGKRFVVGQDCAAKTFDTKLITAVEEMERQRQKRIREERRAAELEERRQQWLADQNAQRERNGGLTDYEKGQVDRAKQDQELVAKFSKINGWILNVLDREPQTDFIRSIIGKLERMKASESSERVLAILRDIWARKFGRRGSKKYKAAEESFDRHLSE